MHRSLVAWLREDLRHHGADGASPGFRALAAYRFGVWRKQLRPAILGKLLRIPYVFLHRRMRYRYRIELHYTAALGRRLRLSDQGDIVIGNGVTIGDDCFVGQGVTIGKTTHQARGWPQIGNRVVIGPGAVIVGDLRIGDGAIIGPNTVVLTNVPEGATVLSRPSEVRGREPPPPTERGVQSREYAWAALNSASDASYE